MHFTIVCVLEVIFFYRICMAELLYGAALLCISSQISIQ